MHALADRLSGRDALLRARDRASGIAIRVPPVAGIAAAVVLEWLAVLALARTVRHNGWVYYQGGDQLWSYTLGWLLGHGELWQTPVGYGWSIFLAPFARIAGPNLVSALPAIVLINVLVFLPIAIAALYGIAVRIGGRIFAYWTLLLWIAVPFLGILYTNGGYHQRYTELTLPQSLGLTAMADFPSMVAALVSLYFCARYVLTAEPELVDAVAAGVAAGVAIGVKPATSLFLLGPACGFIGRRYRRGVGAFVIGLAPSVLALIVWKQRGLGYLPILGHAAGVPVPGLAAVSPIALGLGHYTHDLSWSRLANNIDLLREHFWSGHVVLWLFLAGLVGMLRRSPRAFLLIGGSILPFALVKGSYLGAGIEDASLFRLLMPCFPAFILCLACLPYLLPRGAGRRDPIAAETRRLLSSRQRIGLVALAVAVTALAPIGAFAAARTSLGGQRAAFAPAAQMPIPIDVRLAARATSTGRVVTLRWRAAHPAGGSVFYRVWRSPDDTTQGVSCSTGSGAPLCRVDSIDLGATKSTTFVDRPPRGRWVYRIATAANWLDDVTFGDPYLASQPLDVTVR